jgi:uncharacterized protein YaiI (UPF0178 family)
VDIAIAEAKKRGVECLLLCDTSHEFQKDGAKTLTYSKGADSVDFALVNLVKTGDLVITQDYGLAAMCLARQALVLNQDGMEYTADSIDALLAERHSSKKIRNAGGRLKGMHKRTPAQDVAFRAKLRDMLLAL